MWFLYTGVPFVQDIKLLSFVRAKGNKFVVSQ